MRTARIPLTEVNISGNVIPSVSLAPRPHPALCRLQYGKAGRAWYLFSREHDVISKWQRMKKPSFTYWSTNYKFKSWRVWQLPPAS